MDLVSYSDTQREIKMHTKF